MRKHFYISSLLVLFASVAFSQDMQFTQFYAAPTYLNPALTGANACSRLSTNYRNQWPSIPGGFVSNVISFDHYAQSMSSGFGAMITKDQAGSGSLRQITVSLLYAHELMITRKLGFRSGFQATQNIRDLNFYDLVFGDQLERDDAPTTVEIPPDSKAFYFDVSTGGLFFTNRHWLGFSAHHLNVPNQSLLLGESPVPIKLSLHGGTRIVVKKQKTKDEWAQSISPAFNYRMQGKFDQFDAGLYYSFGVIDFGAWYRGLPGFKAYEPGYTNNDMVALLAGVTIDRFRFAYSFDFTISKLSFVNSGGSHELSMSYQFCKQKTKRKKSNTLLVPCPKF